MSLILRSTKGSPLTFSEMDDNLTYLEGRGFPFIGDATIDGTLNIDFTDTLSFATGQDFGNDLMGFKVESTLGSMFMGVTGDENEAAAFRRIESDLGVIEEYVATTGGVVSVGYDASFPTEQVTFQQQTFVIDEVGAFSIWKKVNDDETDITLGYSSGFDGLILANSLSDPEASLLDIRDNSDDTIFEVRNDGLFVGPNIPTADPLVLGQIWSDNGVLTISAGTP